VTPGDLFDAAADEALAQRAPLAARLRPRSLDEVVGQSHLVGPRGPLRALAEADRLGSAVLWGPPGTGKTTLARILAESSEKVFVPLSATASGVKEVRAAIDDAKRRLGERGQGTVLFIDEVHRFNKAQQDVLLPAVEDGLVVLIGATTENPYFEVNAPLMSRSTLWRLEPLTDDELSVIVGRGLVAEGATAADDAVDALCAASAGDARSALNTLEVAVALARAKSATAEGPGEVHVRIEEVAAARDRRIFHQGVDEHYDQISALIKSVRGSDPDAGLYWLARMLESGEDPRFLARRLVILASEDVGMADPLALVVADAASRAVEVVGMPEAALNLAQCVVYLASAPKSNRVTVALGRATDDVRAGTRGEVPNHLRDGSSPNAAARLGEVPYRYPHDDPAGWVDQQYRPAELEDHRYYEPSEHGAEAEIAQRIRSRRRGEGDAAPR
jgi:putative ATPase